MNYYKNAIEINDVTKKYKGFTVDNISFNLPYGSIMGLIGHNGSGKTTTIRSMLHITNIDKGEIKIFGLDHIRKEKDIKERISVVFDELPFHDMFNAVDISKIFNGLYLKWNYKAYDYYLKRFKIPKMKKIGEYSKEMKMKLQIACALSHDAELLIMDEPITGLDRVVCDEILHILIEYRQYVQCSILMSSDNISDLEKIADSVTYMDNGKILISGYKDELLYHHCVIKCSKEEVSNIDQNDIISVRVNDNGAEVMINNRESAQNKYGNMVIEPVKLEQIIMFYDNQCKKRWS